MKPGNLLTITAANIRMNHEHPLLPAIAVLSAIPLLYGTAHLDPLQSADCLGRMAALIGIPMFTPLTRPEHANGLYETVAPRPVPLGGILALRTALSTLGTLLLIVAFELYMRLCGCTFPLVPYAFRTLAASMALGLPGLLLSSMLQNTIAGYLGAFCLYLMVQAGNGNPFF